VALRGQGMRTDMSGDESAGDATTLSYPYFRNESHKTGRYQRGVNGYFAVFKELPEIAPAEPSCG